MANQATGLLRIYKAAGYSIQGLAAAWRHEAAFRQEVILLIIATLLAGWLNVTPLERLLLIGSVVLVIIIEVLNSALEAVVDRIGTERHELAGRAKDLGSAAVMLTLLLALTTWLTVLGSHYL